MLKRHRSGHADVPRADVADVRRGQLRHYVTQPITWPRILDARQTRVDALAVDGGLNLNE